MANLAGFDASQVPEQQEFSALPEGQYVAIATASEMKVTAKGNGEYLQFTFEVMDGQQRGRKLWARMNLKNHNQTAVDIAQRELGAFCRAVGIIKPADSAELHNKPVLLTVGLEMDDRRRESNVIRKYDPVQAPAFAAAPSNMTTAQPASQWNVTPPPAAPAQAPWMK